MSSKVFRFLLVLGVLLATVGTAAAQEPIVLTLWDGYVTQSEAIERAIDEFEAENPGVTIERTIQSDWQDLVPLALEAGTGPDIFPLPQDNTFKPWVDSGWLLDLTQFDGFLDIVDRYPDPNLVIAQGGNAYGDAVYSLPIDAPLPWLQMYVNTGLYREAGVLNDDGTPNLPETWEELIENSRVIHERTGKYGYVFGGADTWAFGWQWWICQLNGPAYSFRGFGWDNQEGRFRSAELPCFQGLIDGLLTMRDEGLIPPNAMSLTDEQARAMFADGEAAHIQGGVWIMPGWAQTHPEFTDYTLVPLPIVDAEGPRTGFFTTRGGRSWGLNGTLDPESPEGQAAFAFFDFLHSPAFGRIWGETGNGLLLLTPGDPAQYGSTPAMSAYLSMGDLTVVQPPIELRNPDTSQLQTTLIGPNETDILVGLYTGQITDLEAALADLDQRNTEALLQGIEDANAAGLSMSIEDFIVEDWDATYNYEGTFEQ